MNLNIYYWIFVHYSNDRRSWRLGKRAIRSTIITPVFAGRSEKGSRCNFESDRRDLLMTLSVFFRRGNPFKNILTNSFEKTRFLGVRTGTLGDHNSSLSYFTIHTHAIGSIQIGIRFMPRTQFKFRDFFSFGKMRRMILELLQGVTGTESDFLPFERILTYFYGLKILKTSSHAKMKWGGWNSTWTNLNLMIT